MTVVFFSVFGPYVRARVSALSEWAPGPVVGLEGGSISDVYDWDPTTGGSRHRTLTLFPGESLESQPPRLVFRRMFEVLDSLAPRTVAIPGWDGTGSLAALSWCLQNDTPAVLMSESTGYDKPRPWWREAVKRRVVRLFSAALVGGTPHVEYAATLGTPRERIFTGYDVVDNDHFAAGALAAQARADRLREKLGLPARFFLASSRFVEKKNLPRLIRAYAGYRSRTAESAWHLVLLGDGPLRSTLKNQVRELKLEHCIHMPGFKQYDELPAYYGLAKAFVHASTTEQWGLVVNEAMAAGLPIIVSDRCGCSPNLVHRGCNGFVFDPYDEETLTASMLRMASTDCDRAAMAAASREIINRWTPQTFAENLLKATDAARAAPVPKPSLIDVALLRALAHR